jgi:hypothetical protein
MIIEKVLVWVRKLLNSELMKGTRRINQSTDPQTHRLQDRQRPPLVFFDK